MTTLVPLEDINNLAERLIDLMAETHFDVKMKVIEAKHAIGKEIVEDTLYTKYAKGSGGLIKDLARMLDQSESDLYSCVQFVESYPDLSVAVATMATGTKQLSWTQVRRYLASGGILKVCEHEWVERVFKKCKKCGVTHKQ